MSEKTIYLAYTTSDMVHYRDDLMFTLFKAGFKVVPLEKAPDDEHQYKALVHQNLAKSDCSIHIVGNEFGVQLSSEGNLSRAEYEYHEAKKNISQKTNFKVFVWHPQNASNQITDSKQSNFISDLENSIVTNMTYTTTPSTIQLADDIRSMLEVIEKPQMQLSNVDIFFINNIIDDGSADEITDMLSDVTTIEKMAISQKEDKDYAEISSQQIPLSKLAVVYFKDSAEWAIPFAQQVWKNAGGAASQTPILVIGDQNPETNKDKKLKAPNVICMIVHGELIPLEIKVQLDKVNEMINDRL